MPQIIYYLIKVILVSAILFTYYHLFLKNKVYHAYNRFYLIASIVLSLTLPCLSFNISNYHNDNIAAQPFEILEAVSSSDEYLEEIIIYSHKNNISTSEILIGIYSLISSIFFIAFLVTLFRIYRLINQGTKKQIDNVSLIICSAKGTPFSFFSYLFWNPSIDLNSETGKQVFAHEIAHIAERHTMDKMLINLILVICWINPFFWLIRKELNVIHEFIADKKAVGDNDTSALASMIIKAAFPQQTILLSNHFFYSSIKRRIAMLSKYKVSKANYFSRLIALPVIFFLTAALTLKTSNVNNIQSHYNDEIIVVVIDAGHGGQDGGAVAYNQIQEKTLVLEFAKKVKELNRNSNIRIVLTREDDIYMNPQQKVDFANEAGADLFISIHANNAPLNSKIINSGLEVIVAENDISKFLASSVIASFQSSYPLKIAPNPIKRKNGIMVLDKVNCPSILIEAGYLSNKTDLKYLMTKEAKINFAELLLKGINNYLFSESKTFEKNNTPKNKEIKEPTLGTLNTSSNVKSEKQNKKVVLTGLNYDSVYMIDASEYVQYADEPKRISRTIPIQDNITYMVDGIVVSRAGFYRIEQSMIEDLQVSTGTDKNSQLMIIKTKSPSVTLSGISTNRINIELLKFIKELKTSSPDYEVSSATVYFSGAGFPNVISAELSGGSFQPLQIYFNRIGPGTSVTFDNIKVRNKITNQKMTIQGKGVSFYTDEVGMTETMITEDQLWEPKFPGGKEAWKDFLITHIKPNTPIDEGWNAGTFTITVKFKVNTKGELSDFSTDDFPSSKTAQHCIEVIKNGPKWIPATQKGKKVDAFKKQPITFVVSEQ